MKRKLILGLALTLAVTSITGCQAFKKKEVKTATELLKEYNKKDHKNYDAEMVVSVKLEENNGGQISNIDYNVNSQITRTKGYGHGNLSTVMNYNSDENAKTYEEYIVDDGEKVILYNYDDMGFWYESLKGFMYDPEIFVDFMVEDVFKDAALESNDKGYTVTLALDKAFENEDFLTVYQEYTNYYSSVGMDTNLTDAVQEASKNVNIVYTFDKDFNMTSAKFDEVQANIDDTSEEYIYSINIVLNAECKYEKNGEIKEADVKIPEDVLENLAP